MIHPILKTLSAFALLAAVASCAKDVCPYADERMCDRDFRDSLVAAEPCFYSLNAVPGEIESGNRVVYSPDEFVDVQRKVLLEYYTGFRCANCPPASATARNIKQARCGDVVLAFIHATPQFAAPLSNHPSGWYTEDLRSEESNTYIMDFQLSSLPSGIVNRKQFGGTFGLAAGQWLSEIEAEQSESAEAFLRIRGAEFDPATRMMSLQVAYRFLGPDAGDFNLTVGTLENDIIEAQKDGSEDLYPYEHDFVFRGNANGTYGASLSTTSPPLAPGRAVLYEISFEIDEDWNENNLYFFALLNHEDTREVIQADGFFFAP